MTTRTPTAPAPTRLQLPRVNRRGHVLTHAPACPRCGCIHYDVNIVGAERFLERAERAGGSTWAAGKAAVTCRVCGHGFEGIRIRSDGVCDLLVPIHDARCSR